MYACMTPVGFDTSDKFENHCYKKIVLELEKLGFHFGINRIDEFDCALFSFKCLAFFSVTSVYSNFCILDVLCYPREKLVAPLGCGTVGTPNEDAVVQTNREVCHKVLS